MQFSSLISLILYFNAVLFAFLLVFYCFDRRRGRQQRVDLEEFCGSLPQDAQIKDPYVLENGRWVCRNTPEQNTPV